MLVLHDKGHFCDRECADAHDVRVALSTQGAIRILARKMTGADEDRLVNAPASEIGAVFKGILKRHGFQDDSGDVTAAFAKAMREGKTLLDMAGD